MSENTTTKAPSFAERAADLKIAAHRLQLLAQRLPSDVEQNDAGETGWCARVVMKEARAMLIVAERFATKKARRK